jgi:hydroxyethylthiazole kinase
VAGADGLLINLGTLDAARREAIGIAVETADACNMRWSLDPVHCDASPPRFAFAKALIAKGPAVVRGNAREMARLVTTPDGLGQQVGPTVFVRTGPRDRVHFGHQSFDIANGHEWLALATGTGCLTGALISAFLSVEPEPAIAASAALLAIGIAAEIAAGKSQGPGSFAPALIDALHALDPKTMRERARILDAET